MSERDKRRKRFKESLFGRNRCGPYYRAPVSEHSTPGTRFRRKQRFVPAVSLSSERAQALVGEASRVKRWRDRVIVFPNGFARRTGHGLIANHWEELHNYIADVIQCSTM
jgi:hypothetical protein